MSPPGVCSTSLYAPHPTLVSWSHVSTRCVQHLPVCTSPYPGQLVTCLHQVCAAPPCMHLTLPWSAGHMSPPGVCSTSLYAPHPTLVSWSHDHLHHELLE